MIRFKENESNTPKAVLQREKIEIERTSLLFAACTRSHAEELDASQNCQSCCRHRKLHNSVDKR